MRMKETIQIGEKIHAGGAKTGLIRLAYQRGIPGRAGYHPIYPASRQTAREPARVEKLLITPFAVICSLIWFLVRENI